VFLDVFFVTLLAGVAFLVLLAFVALFACWRSWLCWRSYGLWEPCSGGLMVSARDEVAALAA
jgi:hypothetical protein